MKSIFLASMITAATAIISSNALACSCMSLANPQQASKGESSSVLKVKLKSYDPATYEGVMTVEKVYKGTLTESEIKVQGGDGASCGAMIDPDKKEAWVAIVNEGEAGMYYTGACSQSTLDISADGKIEVYLNEKVSLTEQEFTDFVNLKTVPSVKNLTCEASVSRGYYNAGTTKGLDDIGFYERISGTQAEPLSVSFSKDFSAEGLENIYKVNASASMYSEAPQFYYVDVNVTEPFYGMMTTASQTLDITENEFLNYTSLSTYKDVSGKSKEDYGDDPFYGLDAGARCGLVLGAPLVSVK